MLVVERERAISSPRKEPLSTKNGAKTPPACDPEDDDAVAPPEGLVPTEGVLGRPTEWSME